MRIPDGDLVPARRRRYTGGYGRSRRRRTRRAFAVVAVLLIGGSAIVWALQRDKGSPASLSTGTPCPTPSAKASPAALPAPAQVRLVVLNGTSRNQLAQQVGAALVARGFVVPSTGNAPAALAGASVVSYGPGAQPAATVLARNVLGARLVAAPRAAAASLQLVLGSDYRRLATPAEVAAAGAGTSLPALAPVATATPCPA